MPSVLDRIRNLRVQRCETPSPVELQALANDLIFRAHRIEIHAGEIWSARESLNRHLAACPPGSALETKLVEAMRHMPSVASIISLGEAARGLGDLAAEAIRVQRQQVAAPAAPVPAEPTLAATPAT